MEFGGSPAFGRGVEWSDDWVVGWSGGRMVGWSGGGVVGFKDLLRSLWDPLGTVLGPFWVHFGKAFEAKIDASIDPEENVKNAFSPRRE